MAVAFKEGLEPLGGQSFDTSLLKINQLIADGVGGGAVPVADGAHTFNKNTNTSIVITTSGGIITNIVIT